MTFDDGALHIKESCIFPTLEVVTSFICCTATTAVGPEAAHFRPPPAILDQHGPAPRPSLTLPCNPFVHPALLLITIALYRLFLHTFHSHSCFFVLILLPSTVPPYSFFYPSTLFPCLQSLSYGTSLLYITPYSPAE